MQEKKGRGGRDRGRVEEKVEGKRRVEELVSCPVGNHKISNGGDKLGMFCSV